MEWSGISKLILLFSNDEGDTDDGEGGLHKKPDSGDTHFNSSLRRYKNSSEHLFDSYINNNNNMTSNKFNTLP